MQKLNEKFCKKLYEVFGDIKLVTLGDLVKKIAIVSKVRIGSEERMTDQFYQEISLSDIDSYGIIHPPRNQKELGKANATALANQTLNPGDIVLSHRARTLTLGLFDGRYDQYPLIAQNSMMRIQFAQDRKVNTPLFIQAYLRLHLVRSHLNSITEESEKKQPLSASHLLDLPIPYFEEHQNPYSLKDLYYGRIDTYNEISRMASHMRSLEQKGRLMYEEMLRIYLQNDDIPQTMEDDKMFIKHLHEIRESLDTYLSDYKKRMDDHIMVEENQ
ncbi:MAG: hypothetical protein PHX13_10405 [Thiovulaceae bacterium]|nr:hypothetical protein [Sulfurimonadaceae bacterium]